VRLVAQQIGYRPNRAGVRLRTGKTNVISLILSVETEVLGISSNLVYGISEYLAGTPYHLIVTPYSPNADPLDPVRYIVETGSADGVIFSRTEPEDARVRYLHERGFAFATHGRTEMDIAHPYFDFDNDRFGEIAVEHLARRGRRRLALLAPPSHLTYASHMSAGFARGIERLDLIDLPLRAINTESARDATQREIDRVVESHRRPDGFVCGSATSALEVVLAAERHGLVLGRDFDLVVKESFGLLKMFRPEIQVVHENFRAAGKGLAEAVVRVIEGAPVSELQSLEVPDDALT
jgi:LacI family transcriptional regulator